MEEEKKIIINENVDNMLKELEGLLKVAIPIKSNAEFVNEVLFAPLSDETKEKVISEVLEDGRRRLNGEEDNQSI